MSIEIFQFLILYLLALSQKNLESILSMLTSLFDYHLPSEKIAQHPLEPRDSSRLLLCQKAQSTKHKAQNEGIFEEMIFRDIVDLFHP